MPTSQLNITSNTPLGATLVPGGATFRTWAPAARRAAPESVAGLTALPCRSACQTKAVQAGG